MGSQDPLIPRKDSLLKVAQRTILGKIAILRAVQEENVVKLAALMEINADLSARTTAERYSPLHVAVISNNKLIVKMLLEEHADTEARDRLGKTALHYAVQEDRVEILELLLQAGAKCDVVEGSGNTPLMVAVEWRCVKGIERLVKVLPRPLSVQGKPTNKSSYPLHFAVEMGFGEIVEILLEAGFDPSLPCWFGNHGGSTPLHCAASRNFVAIARSLLRAGSEPSLQDVDGDTPLHLAIRTSPDGSNSHMSRLLLQFSCDLSVANSQGRTPLHEAVKHQRESEIILLLDAGSDIAARNRFGQTPLHLALLPTSPPLAFSVIRALVDRIDNLSTQDCYGCTPLHYSTQRADFELTKVLLDRGSNPSIRNDKGITPLHIAVCLATHEKLNVLLDTGQLRPYLRFIKSQLFLSSTMNDGRRLTSPTRLVHSARARLKVAALKIVRTLLDRRPNWSITAGPFFETPAQMASSRPETPFEIIQMLSEAGHDLAPSSRMSLQYYPWFGFFAVRLQNTILEEHVPQLPDSPSLVDVDIPVFPGNFYTWSAISRNRKSIDLDLSLDQDYLSLLPPGASPTLHCSGPLLVAGAVGESISLTNQSIVLILYHHLRTKASNAENSWVGKLWIDEGHDLEIIEEGSNKIVRVVPDKTIAFIDVSDVIWGEVVPPLRAGRILQA